MSSRPRTPASASSVGGTAAVLLCSAGRSCGPGGNHHGANYSSDSAANGTRSDRKCGEIGKRSNSRSGKRSSEHDECKPYHEVPCALEVRAE
jgi:hypothetical protein